MTLDPVPVVEMAVVLPLLLFLSVAIFEFGRAYQTWQVLTNAAREGARVAVLPNQPSGTAEARARLYLTAGQLPNAATATIDVTSTTISIGGISTPGSKVTVSYPYSFMVLQPVARLVVANSNVGAPLTMTASAEMRNEQ